MSLSCEFTAQHTIFMVIITRLSPCPVLHLCLISTLSDVELFFAQQNRTPYLLSHCEGCLLKAFDTHRNSSPTYPTTTPSSVACSETDRQTDRQTDRTGTKGPRPNVDPLWGMATLVRHSNKKWSPRPL